jgi:LysR family positive regulator for ilvC
MPEKLPAQIEYLYITETPLVWIKSKNYRLRQRESIDFHANPLILPRQGIARSRFDKWCKTKGIEPSIYAQVTGNEAIIAMVHLGCGIGLVPEMVLKTSPVMNTILVIENGPSLKPYKIGICVNRKMLTNPLTEAFWKAASAF